MSSRQGEDARHVGHGIGASVYERCYGAYAEALRPFVEAMPARRIVARIAVGRAVSWDNRKLGRDGIGPYAAPLTNAE